MKGLAPLKSRRLTGEDACNFTAMQADKRAEGGDTEGRRVWLSILEAIEELQRARPGRGPPRRGARRRPF